MPKLNVQALSDFLESVDYPVLISISDSKAWCISESGRKITWVSTDKDNNTNGYECYLPEGHKRQDGYLVANLDTQTGCWQTEIFSEANELSEEEFYDKYEEYL